MDDGRSMRAGEELPGRPLAKMIFAGSGVEKETIEDNHDASWLRPMTGTHVTVASYSPNLIS
jgi:hypothetical protein